MKKKEGFTLIELLAVIVILAVIIVIAIPMVSNSLGGAKKDSFKVYAKKVLNTVEAKYQSDMLTSGTSTKTCYTLDELMGQSKGSYEGYVLVCNPNSENYDFKVTIENAGLIADNSTLNDIDDKVVDGNLSSLTCPAAADITKKCLAETWYNFANGKKGYYDANGALNKSKWVNIKTGNIKNCYYFNGSGYMIVAKTKISGSYSNFNADGVCTSNCRCT